MDTNQMERILLLEVLGKAAKVVGWDYTDLDADAARDMTSLRLQVDQTESFLRLRAEAEKQHRAAMYQNVAGI
jgi:hypothetical protein